LGALGGYAMIGNNAILTERNRTGANPERANLHIKRFVVFREPSSRDVFQNSAIKELTGGGTFSGRGLYQSETTKKLCLTCVVECNKKPLFAETPQEADIRRVIDIPFRNLFTDDEHRVNPVLGIYRANPNLNEDTFQKQHRCAFLKIIMDAYTRYANDQYDLKIPQSIKKRTNEYLQLSCDLYQWILDNYEKTEDMKDIVKIKDMYVKFKLSDFYDNLSRADKRSSKYTERGFIMQIKDITFLDGHYFERKSIDDIDHRNILRGFKLKKNCPDTIFTFAEE